MTFSLNANIAWRVAELLRTCGIEIDQEHRGPVLLGRLFDECGLRHAAIPHLCRRAIQAHLMEYGIVVGDLGPEEEPLSGFLFTQGPRGWAFVNAADILPRRRFTAAHELGHFVLHREQMITGYFIDTDQNVLETMPEAELQIMEQEANRFAVELLMPEHVCVARARELKKRHGSCPRLALINVLSAELLVSREAMRYRLQALELGDD